MTSDERLHGGMLPPSLSGPTADRWLAVLLGVLMTAVHATLNEPAGALVELPSWTGVPMVLAMAAALAWRRADPERVMGVVGTLTAVYYMSGQNSPAAFVLVVFALYAITAYGHVWAEGVLSLLVSWFFMAMSYVVSGERGLAALLTSDFALSAFVFGVAWALGGATRSRVALTDELRRRNAQLAVLRERERDELVTGERHRIARELHDVVSHTVSVVVVQAAAAGRVAEDDPSAVKEALGAIERAARDAMAELRRMLGVLREDERDAPIVPAPGGDSIRHLVQELQATGMPVALDGHLPPDVPLGVTLTTHRIVQEALTNVLRHADDVRAVDVRLAQHEDGTVTVEVTDDGRPAGFTGGSGAGLVGMRERAALHGGTVEAGPLPGRGFRVRATIPTRG